jgi:hypothetical protein
MSSLILSKLYGDTDLLYKSDIDTMLDELEAKTNGDIDASNLASGWGNLGQLTLAKDITFTMGGTDTAYWLFVNSSNELKIGNTHGGADVLFKVESAEAARIDSSANDFLIQKDVYFKDRSTAFSLYRLIGTYQKPVLVYVSSTVIDVENNTETANQTLICFGTGPVAVTEDTSSTNKFRRLSLSATANGYGSTHTGAADSGLRVGLSLSANTWYFVYAVRVQYGDDAGNNFILSVDDSSPVYTNHSTLNSRYGTGEWVYLGCIRRGYGASATTTLIPFTQDHQGWTCFTDRGAADNFFGIEMATTTVTSSSATTKLTFSVANSGNAFPANFVAFKMDIQTYEDGDGDFETMADIWFSASGVHAYLPHLESDGGQMGYSIVLPVISGGFYSARRQADDSGNDAGLELYVTGFLDHMV